jgi:hypothetical protein
MFGTVQQFLEHNKEPVWSLYACIVRTGACRLLYGIAFLLWSLSVDVVPDLQIMI